MRGIRLSRLSGSVLDRFERPSKDARAIYPVRDDQIARSFVSFGKSGESDDRSERDRQEESSGEIAAANRTRTRSVRECSGMSMTAERIVADSKLLIQPRDYRRSRRRGRGGRGRERIIEMIPRWINCMTSDEFSDEVRAFVRSRSRLRAKFCEIIISAS